MAATELSQFVDDPEDDADEGRNRRQEDAKQTSWLAKKIASLDFDPDRVFAYKSFKIVRIRDRKLGLAYWSIVTCIIMYVIIVAINLDGKHTEQVPGVGTTLMQFQGKCFSDRSEAYDNADLRFPVIEPSGAFLMTTRVSMKNQEISQCVDWDSPKRCPCDEGEVCVDDYCNVTTWCPSLGDHNVETGPAGVRVDRIHGFEQAMFRIYAGIRFNFIGNHDWFYVAGDSKNSDTWFKNATLKEIFDQVAPPHGPLELKDVLDRGAIIGINFMWNCDTSMNSCEPDIKVTRLDGKKGFSQKRVSHTRKNGKEYREAIYMYGIRIIVDSSGIGRRIETTLIVIQIGSCLALLRIASMVADFLMMHCSLIYDQDHLDKYAECKVEDTDDYTDLQDRLNLVREGKQRPPADEKAEILGRQEADGAGASVRLGLGPGGRGGMASAILRGRTGM